MRKRILSFIAGAASLLSLAAADVSAQAITATWTQKSTVRFLPDGPGPRSWSNLFYDSTSQRVALFGGSAGGGFKRDVWNYNVATDQWTAIDLPTDDCPGWTGFTGPDGRDAQTSGFDPVNNLYWSFAGGGNKCGNLPSRTAGAGTTTTAIVDPTLTATEANFYKDWTVTIGNQVIDITAYDPATKTLTLARAATGLAAGVLYKLQVWTEGQSWFFSPLTKTWGSLEGAHWGAQRPSPVVAPAFRYTPGLAYSKRDNVFVLHGGGLGGAAANDTWVLNPATKTWTQKTPNSITGFPLKVGEISSALVYDEANDVFILFGGRCGDSRCAMGKPTGDTWAYRLSTNTWTKMTPATSPAPRTGAALYYDPNVGKVVMFGGAKVDVYNVVVTAADLYNDLWAYDYPTNTWTQLSPAVSPSPRWIPMVAFDEVARKAVFYAGKTPTTSAEVWTLELSAGNRAPVASFTASATAGTTLTDFVFDSSGSSDPDGSIAGVAWDFGDGGAATTAVATHRYAAAGSYVVRLTVTDDLGLTATTTRTVTVTAAGGNAAPTAVAAVNPTTGTTATNFAFSAAGSADADGSIVAYQWNFGDGSGATGTSASHQYAAAGTYPVTLTVTDNLGATGTASLQVVVSAPAALPSISFKRTIAGATANGTVTQVLVNGVAVPFTVSGADFTTTVSAAAPGSVNVSIQASGAGGTTTQALTVTVP